jgi:hypothetical protein
VTPTPHADRRWALLLLAIMAVHTYYKWTWGTLPELLWGCNMASFAIILGLWIQSPAVTGMAFLWHLGISEPGWLVEVIRTGQTHWVSVLVHTLPAFAGFLYLRRTGLPRSAPWLAFLMFVALVPISHYLTPARLNVNLAHQRLAILQRWFPGNWDYRLAFSAGMLGVLLLWDLALGRILGRPGRLEP